MTVWDDLVGQTQASDLLRSAVARAVQSDAHIAHSWLITGPPGSGRSNAAYAFAAGLLCADSGCGTCSDCRQVKARAHPDLAAIATDKVIISIDDVRALVASSQFSPSSARFRVMVIEDADRMTERTSNVLLKALEEPPDRTIWILCAPSEADLLPTVRSRVRSVRLSVPDVSEVASLLQHRDGIDPVTSERAARQAQSHIGMAHRLATNPEARARREETLRIVLEIRSVSAAVAAAARLLELAKDDAEAFREYHDAKEREATLHSLGIETGRAIPSALRAQIKTMEDDQKRRATRHLRDGIDRILLDLFSLYRDILLCQLAADQPIINQEISQDIHLRAAESALASNIAVIDAIATARRRIARNVNPTLALEAMLITVAMSVVLTQVHE